MPFLPRFATPVQMSRILEENFGVEMSPDRLIELSLSDHMPHVKVDGKIAFYPSKVEQYISWHFLEEFYGKPFPSRVAVFDPDLTPRAAKSIPASLAPISGDLLELGPYFSRSITCVYFLIKAGEVIYVGQSVNLLRRIQDHYEMKFDRVLFLTVPADDLYLVESGFIRALKPPMNSPSTYREKRGGAG